MDGVRTILFSKFVCKTAAIIDEYVLKSFPLACYAQSHRTGVLFLSGIRRSEPCDWKANSIPVEFRLAEERAKKNLVTCLIGAILLVGHLSWAFFFVGLAAGLSWRMSFISVVAITRNTNSPK